MRGSEFNLYSPGNRARRGGTHTGYLGAGDRGTVGAWMHVDLRFSEAISVTPPHVYAHGPTLRHICIHMNTHSDTCARTCIHLHSQEYTLRHKYTHMCTHMNTHSDTCTYMCPHAFTWIHRHMKTTHTHTHTHTLKNLILKTGKCIHINLGPKGLAVEKIEAPRFVCAWCLSRDLQLRHRPLWEVYPCFSPTRVDLFTFLQVQTSASITRSPWSALLGVKLEPAPAPHGVWSAQSTSAPEA